MLLQNTLNTWKKNIKQLKLKKEQQKQKYKRKTLLMFCEWKNFMQISKREKYLKQESAKLRERHLMRKPFKALKIWHKMYHLDAYRDTQLTKSTTQAMNYSKVS